MKNRMKLISSIVLLLCWVVNPIWAQQVVPEVRQAVSFDLHETLQAESRTYLATETLTADNTIEADAQVVYEADKKVVMAVGFHAKGGSYFRASPRRSEAKQNLIESANQAAVAKSLVYPNPNQGQFSVRIASSAAPRSEEHTSELQSQSTISYAVFCLKKKKKTKKKKQTKKKKKKK